MKLLKVKKETGVTLVDRSENPTNCNKQNAALAGLAIYLDQTNNLCNVKKAALMGLALYLNEKKSHVTNKEVAAAALAYHLAKESGEGGFQSGMQTYPTASAWAFKGFLMRQTPNRIIKQNRFN